MPRACVVRSRRRPHPGEARPLRGRRRTRTIEETKTSAGRRVLPMAPFTKAALVRLRSKVAGMGERLVFVDRNGNPLRRSNLTRTHLRPLWTAAGLGKRVHFHSLRHSSATLALASGAALRSVSASFGHRDASFTVRTYAHTVEGAVAQSVTGLDRIISGRGPRTRAHPRCRLPIFRRGCHPLREQDLHARPETQAGGGKSPGTVGRGLDGWEAVGSPSASARFLCEAESRAGGAAGSFRSEPHAQRGRAFPRAWNLRGPTARSVG